MKNLNYFMLIVLLNTGAHKKADAIETFVDAIETFYKYFTQ